MQEINMELAKRRSIPMDAMIRSMHGDLLEAAAGFANSTWTEKERLAFENCECERHDARSGGRLLLGSEKTQCNEPAPLYQVAVGAFSLLTGAALDFSSNYTASRKLEKDPDSGRRSKWPSSPSQFIPHGPSAALSAFMNWAYIMSSATPIQLLFHLTSCCPSLAPVITDSDTVLPLLEHLIRQLISSVKSLALTGIPDRPMLYLAQDTMCFRSIFFCEWFRNQTSKTEYVERRAQQLFALHEAISDCSSMLDKIKSSQFDLEGLKAVFCTTGMLIYKSLSSTSNPLPPPQLAFASMIEPFMGEFDIVLYSALLCNVRVLRIKRKCAEIPCFETGEDTRTNFKWCSTCGAVRYCSRTCQVSDWKKHKQVCKLLKRILPLALEVEGSTGLDTPNMSMVMERMRSAFRRGKEAGLTEKDLELLTAYVNAHAKPQVNT